MITGEGQLPLEPKLLLEPGTAAASLGPLQEEPYGIRPSTGRDVRFIGEGARYRGGGCAGRVRVWGRSGRPQLDIVHGSGAGLWIS